MKGNYQFNLFENEIPKEEIKNEIPKEEIKTSLYSNKVVVSGIQKSSEDSKKKNKLKNLINSRLKEVEKLDRLLAKDKETIDQIKKRFDNVVSDDLSALQACMEKLISKLIMRYGQKSFSRPQKETIDYLIQKNIEELMSMQYSSDSFLELLNKYQELKEKEYASFYNEEEDEEYDTKEDDIELIREMLANMGLEVDESIFENLDPKDPDFQEKFQERFVEFQHEKEKEIRQEEQRKSKVDTDKDFNKMYKMLVKKVHPDLTTDVIEKERREILMKELSEVWEQRDYYKLLILQATILDDPEKEMKLDENHLNDLAGALFKKIKDLRQQRFMLKKDGENGFYYENFYSSSRKKIHEKIEAFRFKLKQDCQMIEDEIQELKTQKTTKDYLSHVKGDLMMSSVFSVFKDTFDDESFDAF